MEFMEAIISMNQKFTSLNIHPVERATIIREEFEAIAQRLSELEKASVEWSKAVKELEAYTERAVCVSCECGNDCGNTNNRHIFSTISKFIGAGDNDIDDCMKDGHTEHCAKRIVWGDGVCECNMKGDGVVLGGKRVEE